MLDVRKKAGKSQQVTEKKLKQDIKADKKKRKKRVQSVQQNIPIGEITNGLVVTKDGDFTKIIEVNPAPFFLKKINEQN